MALLFGDSFDHYPIDDIMLKWTSFNQMPNSVISADYALPPHDSGLLTAGNSNGYFDKSLPSTYATFIAGVWFRTGSTASNSIIMSFLDGTTEHVSVRYTTAGNITFTRNGTVLATSSSVISTNVWYHIEVKATISDASGAYEVRVNGTATGWIAAATSADTKNGGNTSISNVRIYSRGANDSSSTNHRFQDYYVLDTSGSVANDFLGPCRFVVLRPAGAGSSAQWTGNYADNWQNVVDRGADTSTTFNQSSTANDIDLFSMTHVPAGTVHAIQHVLRASQDAGAGRTIRPKTRISSTNYNGTTVATAASDTLHLQPVSVSPATSSQWTDTEINGAEFGYELVS